MCINPDVQTIILVKQLRVPNLVKQYYNFQRPDIQNMTCEPLIFLHEADNMGTMVSHFRNLFTNYNFEISASIEIVI